MTMTICIKKLVPAALQGVATTILSLGIFLAISSVGRAEDHERKPLRNLHDIKHIIVIYQENWSFDSLYGLFPGAAGLAQSSPKSLNQTDRFDQPLSAQTGQPFSLVSGSLKLLTPPPPINNGQIDMRKIACIS